MDYFRVAAAQTLEYRDDIKGATDCLVAQIRQAHERGAALICFPEAFLQGYLAEEMSARRVAIGLDSPAFTSILDRLPATEMTIVIGLIETDGDSLFNTAVVVRHRQVVGRYRKARLLQGESAFTPGSEFPVFDLAGLRFGVAICYDMNFAEVIKKSAAAGASLIVCPANNMMPKHKAEQFKHLHNAVRGERCRETGMWLLSADVTGECDGRIGWGPSAVLGPDGMVRAQLPLDAPGLLIFDIPIRA